MENIKGNTFIIKGSTNTGLYIYENNNVVIIDPGMNGLRIKKIRKILNENKLNLTHIILTHEHSDHYGACYELNQLYSDVKILSSKKSRIYIENPELFNKYIMGGKSNRFIDLKSQRQIKGNIIIDEEIKEEDLFIGDEKFNIIELPGHTPGSIGVITPDNILFSGDAIIGMSMIDKYDFLFTYDIADQISTYKKIRNLAFEYMIISHSNEIFDKNKSDIILKRNEESTYKYINQVLDILKTPRSIDKILENIINFNKLSTNYKEYNYLRSSLVSIISYLENKDKIDYILKEGQLLYCTKVN